MTSTDLFPSPDALKSQIDEVSGELEKRRVLLRRFLDNPDMAVASKSELLKAAKAEKMVLVAVQDAFSELYDNLNSLDQLATRLKKEYEEKRETFDKDKKAFADHLQLIIGYHAEILKDLKQRDDFNKAKEASIFLGKAEQELEHRRTSDQSKNQPLTADWTAIHSALASAEASIAGITDPDFLFQRIALEARLAALQLRIYQAFATVSLLNDFNKAKQTGTLSAPVVRSWLNAFWIFGQTVNQHVLIMNGILEQWNQAIDDIADKAQGTFTNFKKEIFVADSPFRRLKMSADGLSLPDPSPVNLRNFVISVVVLFVTIAIVAIVGGFAVSRQGGQLNALSTNSGVQQLAIQTLQNNATSQNQVNTDRDNKISQLQNSATEGVNSASQLAATVDGLSTIAANLNDPRNVQKTVFAIVSTLIIIPSPTLNAPSTPATPLSVAEIDQRVNTAVSIVLSTATAIAEQSAKSKLTPEPTATTRPTGTPSPTNTLTPTTRPTSAPSPTSTLTPTTRPTSAPSPTSTSTVSFTPVQMSPTIAPIEANTKSASTPTTVTSISIVRVVIATAKISTTVLYSPNGATTIQSLKKGISVIIEGFYKDSNKRIDWFHILYTPASPKYPRDGWIQATNLTDFALLKLALLVPLNISSAVSLNVMSLAKIADVEAIVPIQTPPAH